MGNEGHRSDGDGKDDRGGDVPDVRALHKHFKRHRVHAEHERIDGHIAGGAGVIHGLYREGEMSIQEVPRGICHQERGGVRDEVVNAGEAMKTGENRQSQGEPNRAYRNETQELGQVATRSTVV